MSGSKRVNIFIVLWRMLWLPIIMIGRVLLFIGVLMSHGYSLAKSTWEWTS